MRIRAKEIRQMRKRKKEAYKLRLRAEAKPAAAPVKSTRTSKKNEA